MLSCEPPPSGVRGLGEARDHYGVPVERAYRYAVSEDTYRYWQLVRRKRVAEVVLALRRPVGRYLVHTKGFYPPGVYRLLSGGIKPGEELLAAVQRETAEETSLEVRIEHFLAIQHHCFAWRGQSEPFTSYLFALVEVGGALRVGDEGEQITAFRDVDLHDLLALAENLEALPPDWNDWGRFRATAHRLVVETLRAASPSLG